MKKMVMLGVLCSILLFFSGQVAAMESTNYKITSSVLSGGGGSMGSTSFAGHAVIGQSTPIMQQAMPPESDSFILYPGYLYTLQMAGFCLWDNEPDGDVDGRDLYNFIPGLVDESYDTDDLAGIADQFGKVDCF